MTQARIEINGTPGSDDNLPINTLVQLSNLDTGGEVSYLWSILDQPPGPVDALSATNIENPTFAPTKEGSYLLQLIVNFGLPDEKIDKVVGGIRQFKTLERIPAAGETIEVDLADGWATAMNALLRRIDSLLSDPGIIVGENTSGGVLSHGDVVRVTSGAIIKSGLPGQETVPGFDKAPASTLGNVDELLCVVEGDVAGNLSVLAGDLAKVRYIGRIATIPLGSGVVGDPVYVSDTATLNVSPGSYRRQVGSIMSVSGGNRDVWFDGVGGADITPIDRAYMLYGAPSSGMLNAHRFDGNNAAPGATVGVPYVFKAGDAATAALVAKRFNVGGANPFEVQTEASVPLAWFTAAGNLDLNLKELYRSVIRSPADATVANIIKRWSGTQTADLSQWQDESGSVLMRVNSTGKPAAALDVATKTYVDQTAITIPNFLINGGFDFYQRRNSLLFPPGWTYNNVRAYKFDRWTTYTNNAGESGTLAILVSSPPTVWQGSQILFLQRNAGGVAGSITYINQEIDRVLVGNLKGRLHRFAVTVTWPAMTAPATLTLRFLTGTGLYSEVANPTYPTGNVIVATASFSLGVGGGTQRFALPITTLVGGNINNACVQILLSPATTVSELYYFGAAMLHTSSDLCDVDAPFRRQCSSMAGELVACQRFFEKSWDQNYIVGAATNIGQFNTQNVQPGPPSIPNGGVWQLGVHPKFKVTKAPYVSPVVTLYNPATGNAGSWVYAVAGNLLTGVFMVSGSGFEATNNTGAAVNLAVQRVTGHWTADADL